MYHCLCTILDIYAELHYRTVDGTVYITFQEAAQALGLLYDDAEGQLCFNEARDSGYSPAQLRALLVTLIVDRDEHGGDILESNRDTLMADLDEEVSLPSDVVWNRCLRDLANRLETMGRTMTVFGLPEPADDTTELARGRLRWDHRSCQGFVDTHLPLLTPDEQLLIYEELSDGFCRAHTHT